MSPPITGRYSSSRLTMTVAGSPYCALRKKLAIPTANRSSGTIATSTLKEIAPARKKMLSSPAFS